MNLFGEDFSQIKDAHPIYRISQDTKAMFILLQILRMNVFLC